MFFNIAQMDYASCPFQSQQTMCARDYSLADKATYCAFYD